MPFTGRRFSTLMSSFSQPLLERFDTRIWVIAILYLFTAASFSLSLPFLALYLYQDRGISMTLVGIIILIGGVFSAVTHIMGGDISDRIGRRPILLVAIGIRVLMYSGMAILIGVSAPIWAIALTYIVGQSVGMMARPVLSAMVVDLVPRERLIETYGFLRVALNLGWAAGPAIGGYLATFLPYGWLFTVAASVAIISFLIVLLFLRESFPKIIKKIKSLSILSVVSDKTFLIFTGLSFLVILVAGQMMSTLSIFTVDRMGFSTAQYGLLLTVNGLVVILFQYPVARRVSGMVKSRVLIVGSLFYAIGYLLFGWIGSFALAISAMVILTVGEVTFSPVALSVVGELSPEKHRGRYMGFYELSHTLGLTVGPLLGGLLLDFFLTDSRPIWGIIAFIALLAGIGFYRMGIKNNLN
ncbi:MAG: MFS transporter [Desulfobacteraceae bacterium]|nr:MFS transporter [Desulfobacteraceae bacterium]